MVRKSTGTGRRHCIAVAAVLGVLLGGIAKTEAALYTFTKIADSTGPFTSFGPAAMNERGVVAFSAVLDSGLWGVFTGEGAGTTTLADSSGPFNFFGPPSLSDNGVVAVRVFLDTGRSAIVRTDGSTPTTIAETAIGFRILLNPSVNDDGMVAFFGLDATGGGIFTSDGIAPTTVAHTPVPFIAFGDSPFLANSGAVAFGAFDSAGRGIFRFQGTATTTMAHTSGPPFSLLGPPSLNNEGAVAFVANLDAGGSAIFRSNGSTPTPIADRIGPYNSFGNTPSINDIGMVAFWASLDAGGAGIFTGPNPSTDTVIAVGDLLSGSTVVELTLGREGLNNAGEVAFVARLANGIHAVYRADPVPSELQVSVDIKPGGTPNSINLKSHGTVPVAILTAATFDATRVDPTTVTLAGALVKLKKNGTPMAAYEDVDGDGRADLVLHVSTQDLQLDESSTEAVLKGWTFDEKAITGADAVRIVQ